MTSTFPTVSVRGVLATTRTLHVLFGVALVPLLAQYLFGSRVDSTVIGLFSVSAALVGALLARFALSERSSLLRGSSRVDLQACKLGTGRRFTTS
jgi:hypothetical protein